MNDMTSVIVPKSDQINADDLIGKTMTITIRDVRISGGQEQPVSIYFEGSDKAFRPCKSMSRVLVAGWGPDANKYIGRSLTLFRDASVKWGGMEVGGIRISHMSDLENGAMTLALTATKGSRKPFKVMPLQMPAAGQGGQQSGQTAAGWTDDYIARVDAAPDRDALIEIQNGAAKALAKLKGNHAELYARAIEAGERRLQQLSGEGRSDTDHGDQHDGADDDGEF
jgi:hypothetical protein